MISPNSGFERSILSEFWEGVWCTLAFLRGGAEKGKWWVGVRLHGWLVCIVGVDRCQETEHACISVPRQRRRRRLYLVMVVDMVRSIAVK